MAQPNGGLITETNAQYYEGEQYFESTGQVSLKVTLNTDLNDYGAGTPPQNANYTVAVNTLVSPTVFTDLTLGTYSVDNNIVTIPAQAVGVDIRVKLKANAAYALFVWNDKIGLASRRTSSHRTTYEKLVKYYAKYLGDNT